MRSLLQARLAALVVCSSVLWVLATHSPDMDHIKEDLQQAHDSVFEYLVGAMKYANGWTVCHYL